MITPSKLSQLIYKAKVDASGEGYFHEDPVRMEAGLVVGGEFPKQLLADIAGAPHKYGFENLFVRRFQEDDAIEPAKIISQLPDGAIVHLSSAKRNCGSIGRFFFATSFWKYLESSSYSQGKYTSFGIADDFEPFRTIAGSIDTWVSFELPGDEVPAVDSFANHNTFVRCIGNAVLPPGWGYFIPLDGSVGWQKQSNFASDWINNAWKWLPLLLASDIWAEEKTIRVVVRGHIVRETTWSRSPTLDAASLDTVIDAVRWIVAPAVQAEVRHNLVVSELARLWGNPSDLHSAIKLAIKPAYETARTAYQLHMTSLTAESLRALADLRRALIDESDRVQQSIGQLTATMWRDCLLAGGAVLTHMYYLSYAQSKGGKWFVWGALVFLLVSGILMFYGQCRSLAGSRKSFSAWKLRVYSFVTDDDYKALAHEPIEQVRSTYKKVSVGIAAVYLAMISVLVLIALGIVVVPAPLRT
jgi:hypothetical protein